MTGSSTTGKGGFRIMPFDDAHFDEIVSDCPEATFYHTRCWARILLDTFPQLEDRSIIFSIDDCEYALPAFSWKRLGGLLKTTHSSFPFLYGAPLPLNDLSLAAALGYLKEESQSLVVVGNPFAASRPETDQSAQLVNTEEATHLLALPDTTEAFWNDVLTSRKRNDIRRLTKKGVRVERSTNESDVTAFYDLYLKRKLTWSQAPGLIYPRRLYDVMIAHGGDAVRLYMVRFEDRVIGGTFVCQFNGISHYQAGYYDHDAGRLRPNVLAQNQIIQDAIEEGNRIYDMLPSAGIPSVVKFKESFGASEVTFDRWEQMGRLHRFQKWVRGQIRR